MPLKGWKRFLQTLLLHLLTAKKLTAMFKCGLTSLEYDPSEGQPKMATNNENTAKVQIWL